MAFLPAGSLYISGYGDGPGGQRFLSNLGVDLGQPDSGFYFGSAPGGFRRMSTNDFAIAGSGGGPGTAFSTTGAGVIDGTDISQLIEAVNPSAYIGGFLCGYDASGNYYLGRARFSGGIFTLRFSQFNTGSDTATATWDIAYDNTLYASTLWSMAVSPDGQTVYLWMVGNFAQPDAAKYKIHVISLAGAGSYVGKLDDTRWTSSAPGEGSMGILPDGTIVAAFRNNNGSNPGVVRRYNSGGTLLNTYTINGSGGNAMSVAVDENGTGIWFWAYHFDVVTSSGVRYFHVLASTGADIDSPFDPVDGGYEFDSPFEVLGADVGPPAPTPSAIPNPTPPMPQTDCEPQSKTSTATKGAAGCNDGGDGFVLEYGGAWGVMPVHPEPASHELLTRKDRSTVEAWLEVNTEDYPSGSPVQLLRAQVPLDDDPTYEGGYKTDGAEAFGDVEDALGNEQGGFEATTVNVQVSGARDTTIHTAADDQDYGGAELVVKLASDEARAAHTAPLIMMRAIVQRLQFKSGRQISIDALDQLFSDTGVYGPESKFPHKTYGDLGNAAPDMTEDVKKIPIVPLYGEKTDNGATNRQTGAVNSKGLIPGVFLGYFTVAGLPTPTATTGRTLAAAVALMQQLVDDDADDATWASTLGFDIGTADIVVLKAMGTVPSTYFSLGMVVGFGDLDAVLAQGTTAAPTDGLWGILAFGFGPWYQFTKVCGSDLGGGVAEMKHDRTELDITALAGSQTLVPGDGVCPWTAFTLTNPVTGETFDLAAIGVRGPILDDHINGVVNVAVDGIGLMAADGNPIMGAYDAVFHAVENFMYLGKTAGPWATNATAPQYTDGTYKVNSASFKTCQDYSAASLGSGGLRASWYPDKQASKTTTMAALMRKLEFRMGFDRHGQLRAFLLDEAVSTATWPRIVHEIDVFGDVVITLGESRENVATGVCDWDPDFSRFRGKQQIEKNDTAIAKYRKGTSTGERPGDQDIENDVINDDDHLGWLLRRRVTRLGSGMTAITVVGRREWWDPSYDIGQGVLLNTLDGTGASGYVDRPCVVVRRRFSFATQLVTLTLWDVRDIRVGEHQSLPTEPAVAMRFAEVASVSVTTLQQDIVASDTVAVHDSEVVTVV